MGTEVHLVAVGAHPDVLELGRRHIHELEALWSRFREDSEISRLNSAAPRPVRVSPETIELVRRSLEGWRATSGAFDPTILGDLVALGYHSSFERLEEESPPPPFPRRRGGAAGVVVDQRNQTVRLPEGAAIDPGGIGKGLAADIVAEKMLEAGARGVCVNVGGDLRVAGRPPTPAGWTVGVDDPFGGPPLTTLSLQEGAIATSSRLGRTWMRSGVLRHHLLEPATGQPASTRLAAVTVVAGRGWWAEVLAKAIFLAGPSGGVALLEQAGATGLLLDDNRRLIAAPGMEAFLR
ncbi:MAG: thiamine biosynthesis lipoprotein ApbE [Actinobacteria bacterium]|jgi:thiamine biosynthesis lipoprotein|nr:thiamine biosynthesis lipoprotein ApbE [Actinomycetota bacterium]MEA2590721.1 FAD:protein transferase [Actinomycetota bacterium]